MSYSEVKALANGNRLLIGKARADAELARLERAERDWRHTYATVSFDSGVDPKIVADRIGHANMAYTLSIYTHRSTGKDKRAAETFAGVLLGTGWTCRECGAAYIGNPPEDRLYAAWGVD